MENTPFNSSRLPKLACYLPALLLLLAPLWGCGANKPLKIEGSVTYGGEPVQKGRITFLSPDGKGPTAAAIIADGKYSVGVFPGVKQVKIEGFKVVGQVPYSPGSSEMVDDLEPIIPAKYNEKSELTVEISSGTRSLDFNLEP
ncbi:MAG: hypothetical protein GX594_15845 [Pirellulaceae bacterium]|nr:hypothetical protein [Pirellulaceae bacterium]